MSHERPFTPEDVVLAGSFPAVLATLIFKHPAVIALKGSAVNSVRAKRHRFEEHAGLIGVVIGHDDPVLPVRYFHVHPWDDPWEPPDLDSSDPAEVYFTDDTPKELRAYYNEIKLRALTLFEFLQEGTVIASGHTEDGHPTDIARAVWLHGDYYIHAYQGDVYEGGLEDVLVRRWVGISFKPGVQPEPHYKPSKPQQGSRARKSQAVRAAMDKAGINPVTTELTPKQIAGRIAEFLQDIPRTEAQVEALAKMISRVIADSN
jgi:hypothetical protein